MVLRVPLHRCIIFLACLVSLGCCHEALSGSIEPELQHSDDPQQIEPPSSPYSLKARFRRAVQLVDQPHSRQKRIVFFRVKFPYKTELELKWALNLPVETDKKYKAKLQVALPIKMALPRYLADDVYTPPFNTLFGQPFREGDVPIAKEDEHIETITRRKRALHYTDRQDLYENLQHIMQEKGLPGRQCLLRTICEVAEAPLKMGILGDFVNLIMTPSVATVSASPEHESVLEELLEAEDLGRRAGQCGGLFSACPSSLFDMLPLVKHSILPF